MINRNILDETNSVKELTNQVNDLTDTLTDKNNIFKLVDKLEDNTGKHQAVKLTDDKGLARVKNTGSLKNYKEAGYYFISADAMASMDDKPQGIGTSDFIMHVLPTTSSSDVVQTVYEARYKNDQEMRYRFVQGNSWTSWQIVQALTEGKNNKLNGINVEDITKPGTYYLQNASGVPDGFNKGYITVVIPDEYTKMLRLIDESEKVNYVKTRNSSGDWSEWKREQQPEDMEEYLIGSKDNSISLLLYASDNKSFRDALIEHKDKTGKGIFNFYVQAGVKDSPKSSAIRGVYFSEKNSTYGWYIAVDNSSRMIAGSVAGGAFREPTYLSGKQTIWTGALDLASVNKRQKMNKNIRDFDIVTIYVKIQGTTDFNTGTFKTINNVGHEYYIDGESSFIVQGTLVGSKPGTWDLYRCLVTFDGNEFYLAGKNTAVSTSNAKYITKIVGEKMSDI